jgi:signal transduction histidine kinase
MVKDALAQFFGAVLVVMAFWAGALTKIEESRLRREGMSWFVGGHLTILGVLYNQRHVIWGANHAETAGHALLMTWVTLMLMLGEFPTLSGGPSASWVPCPRGSGPAESQRSRYERQIRAAGAQEERNRLARDLHDSIKQQIFVIQTAAATAQARFESDRTGAAIAIGEIRDSAREAMTEMEVMMDQLRSVALENSGLIEALKKLCEALGHRTGSQVNFQFGGLPPTESLPPGSHQAILRVAQEALANIGRHARAGDVTVSIGSVSNRVELRVQDDGAGFDPLQGPRGMGIANMRTRAEEFGGWFDIASRPGAGTMVTFSIPQVARKSRKFLYSYGVAFAVLVVVWVISGSLFWSLPTLVCVVQLIRQARA